MSFRLKKYTALCRSSPICCYFACAHKEKPVSPMSYTCNCSVKDAFWSKSSTNECEMRGCCEKKEAGDALARYNGPLRRPPASHRAAQRRHCHQCSLRLPSACSISTTAWTVPASVLSPATSSVPAPVPSPATSSVPAPTASPRQRRDHAKCGVRPRPLGNEVSLLPGRRNNESGIYSRGAGVAVLLLAVVRRPGPVLLAAFLHYGLSGLQALLSGLRAVPRTVP